MKYETVTAAQATRRSGIVITAPCVLQDLVTPVQETLDFPIMEFIERGVF